MLKHGALCTCLFFVVCGVAHAQDGRLVGQLFGDRAFGLGGAFTAFADDPSAAYYNPAGLAFGGDKMFAGSLQVFDNEVLSLDGQFAPRPGSDASAQLKSETAGLFPTSGASLSKLSDDQYFSLASFTPLHRNVKYLGVVTDTSRGLTHSVTLSTTVEEKRTLFGPAYGIRLTKSLGLGAALYLSTYTLNRASYRSKYVADNKNPNATTWASTSQYSERYETQIQAYSVSPVISLLYRGDNGLRLGTIARAPSQPLMGNAKLSYRGFRYQNNGVITSELDGEGAAEDPSTWNVRFGIGYERARRFALSFDTSVHLGKTVDSFEAPARFSDILGIDPDIPLQRNLSTVVNFAGGIEYYLTSTLPFRIGAFTNYSANPSIPSLTSGVAYAPHLDEFGGTISVGYYGEKGSVHVGLGAAQTQGYVVLTYPEGTNQLPSRVGAEGLRYFVTLSGAISFAKALVKEKKSAQPDGETTASGLSTDADTKSSGPTPPSDKNTLQEQTPADPQSVKP